MISEIRIKKRDRVNCYIVSYFFVFVVFLVF